MKQRAILFLSSVLFACEPQNSPVQPDAAPEHGPDLAILDGTREGGNPGFYWLPPIVDGGVETGELDGELLPFLSVSICEWDGSECVGEPVAGFNSQGEGGERLRITDDGHFHANWHTDKGALDLGAIYRISAKAGPVELGYADVDVVRKLRDASEIETDEFVALREGRTLPVKFVVTGDGLSSAGAALVGVEGGQLTSADGSLDMTVPAGSLDSPSILVARISGEPAPPVYLGSEVGPGFRLSPPGLRFDEPVAVRLDYSALELPGDMAPEELGVLHWAEDGLVEGLTVENDLADQSLAFSIDRFSLLRYFSHCGWGTTRWLQECEGWVVVDLTWQASTLRYFIAGVTSNSYVTEDRVRRALDTWGAATRLTFVRTYEASRANLIFEELPSTDDACDEGTYFPDTLFGEACFSRAATFWKDELTIEDHVVLKISRGAISGCAGAGRCGGASAEVIAENIVLHEVGHALGLAHPYKRPESGTSVMEVFPGRYPDQLHRWDVAAAEFLYPPPEVEVDGEVSQGEWNDATVIPLTLGDAYSGRFLIKNDGRNMYFAFELPDDPSIRSYINVLTFDDDNSGVTQRAFNGLPVGAPGEDWLILSHLFPQPSFVDLHVGSGPFGVRDQTWDGESVAGTQGDIVVVEASHPLNSGDGDDFSLASGDRVGFAFLVSLGGVGFWQFSADGEFFVYQVQ